MYGLPTKLTRNMGCGRTVWFVEIFVYLHLKQNPDLSNTKGTHSLFEPITQTEDIV